jgi:hypothetical protein
MNAIDCQQTTFKDAVISVKLHSRQISANIASEGEVPLIYSASGFEMQKLNQFSSTRPFLFSRVDLQSSIEVRSADHEVKDAEEAELKKLFKGLVEKWKKETGSSSLTLRRYAHPSYQAILVLGGRDKNVVKLILRELEERPDMWFEALRRLTDENPANEVKTFEGAVKAWLDWGRKKQLIT